MLYIIIIIGMGIAGIKAKGIKNKPKEEREMTKTDEIERLKGVAKEFGNESYIGPWLNEIIIEVERDIRNDFPVSPSLTAARKKYGEIIKSAEISAAAIIDEANKKKTEIEENIYRLTASAADRLMAALNHINNY